MKKRTWKKILLSIALDIIIAYFVAGAILYAFQSRFIYFPSSQDFHHCPGFSDAAALSYNGTRFYEWGQHNKLIVFYHGNAGSACDRAPLKDGLRDMGYSLLFVEYTGYSNDGEQPSTELLSKDIERVQEYITSRNYTSVMLMGESVGACFAAYHARLSAPERMILISPPTSLSDAAWNNLPIYPYSFLMTENCDNRKELLEYQGKILILHGEKDTIVPASLVNELYTMIPSREKELAIIRGADHNTIFVFDETWITLKDYLQQKRYIYDAD
ncbi:alpha/beta hydrolase [Candidatus Woesearchaeota archaeon]|nr:alpha/beta hydrolase [Candidatus Woesearchaeota archaeon]